MRNESKHNKYVFKKEKIYMIVRDKYNFVKN